LNELLLGFAEYVADGDYHDRSYWLDLGFDCMLIDEYITDADEHGFTLDTVFLVSNIAQVIANDLDSSNIVEFNYIVQSFCAGWYDTPALFAAEPEQVTRYVAASKNYVDLLEEE
jgi:hypothetical protein